MSDRADQTIKALRSGHDDLAAMVRGFTADDLARRSGASDWDVSQVLSHLGSGAEIALAALEGALSGSGNPGADFNKGVWARWDGMSREERAEAFAEANEKTLRRYEGLDEETRENLRIDLGFMPAPVDVTTAGRMRLNEYTHHSWDVRVAFDPKATLASEAVSLLFEQASMLIGFTGRADALDGRPLTIAVHTTAPDRSFGLAVNDKVAVVEAAGLPAGTLNAPAEWWLRLATGRHAPEYTPDTVTFTSETMTLDDLRRLFPGF
jgi:uncharacterized protein (TIGR03083 family)